MEVKVFRGQYGLDAAQIQSKLPSISFGSLKSAKIYAAHPNNRKDIIVKPIVLSAIIKIQNPIINNTDDCFADFDLLIEKLGAEFMWHMAEKFSDYIYNTDNWEDNFADYTSISELKRDRPDKLIELYMDAYVLLDDKEFVNYSKELGYDGAIHIGNGQTMSELEYRIFSKKQILNIKEIKYK